MATKARHARGTLLLVLVGDRLQRRVGLLGGRLCPLGLPSARRSTMEKGLWEDAHLRGVVVQALLRLLQSILSLG